MKLIGMFCIIILSVIVLMTGTTFVSAFERDPSLIIQLDKSPMNEHSVIVTITALEEIQILPWGTPLEDRLRFHIFHLEDEDGNICQWEGAMYRRKIPAQPEHLMTLSEGYSVSIEYDLAQLYNCLDAPTSLYRVTLQFPLYAFTFLNGELANIQIRDDGLSVQWQESFVTVPKILSAAFMERSADQLNVLGNTYTNCNSDEINAVAAAVPAAQKQAAGGQNCMAQGSSGCPTAKTWFGTYNSDNWNYDFGCLQNINARLTNNGMAAYCNPSGCSQGVYAYVYPTQCCTVYLCSVFWKIPSERAETIVHEESHFNANSINGKGTQDYAYGQSNCKNLAKSNPTQATHNADNVCYFAAGYS